MKHSNNVIFLLCLFLGLGCNIKADNKAKNQPQADSIINKKYNFPISNTEIPIVCMIYDDSPYIADGKLLEMADKRNLKITFAPIGHANVYNQSWRDYALRLVEAVKRGHGTIAHGVCKGIVVNGKGIDTMNDAHAHLAIQSENKAFDDYQLSHHGVAYFNTWKFNPHTLSLVSKYYDYGFTYAKGNYIVDYQTDLYHLGRYTTDNAGMLKGAKALVDSVIGRNCILTFGGHMTRTGTNDGKRNLKYSTMAEFEELLDYIAQKVEKKQLISLNTDDALRLLYARSKAKNIVKTSPNRNPDVGDVFFDKTFHICLDRGVKAKFLLSINGNVNQDGEFTINIPDSSTQKLTSYKITVYKNDTIKDIVDRIASLILKGNTMLDVSSCGEIIFIHDEVGVIVTPTVSGDSSGLSIEFTILRDGKDAKWE